MDSYHVWGLAYDVGIFKCPVGFWRVEDCKEYLPNDLKAYKIAGTAGVAAGLEWGGNWKKFKDWGHYQYPITLLRYDNLKGLITDYEKAMAQRKTPMAPNKYVQYKDIPGMMKE